MLKFYVILFVDSKKELAQFEAHFVIMSSVYVPSLQDWLESIILLPQYLDVLTDNGYDTLQKCTMLTSSDLDRIGISLPGHKKRILSQLAKFRLEPECKCTESAEISSDHCLSRNADEPKSADIIVEPVLLDPANVDVSITDSL